MRIFPFLHSELVNSNKFVNSFLKFSKRWWSEIGSVSDSRSIPIRWTWPDFRWPSTGRCRNLDILHGAARCRHSCSNFSWSEGKPGDDAGGKTLYAGLSQNVVLFLDLLWMSLNFRRTSDLWRQTSRDGKSPPPTWHWSRRRQSLFHR